MDTSTPADRLQWAMKQTGLENAAEVGRLADVNAVTMRAYANGTRNPPLDVAIRIGRVLKVSGQWIFDGKGASADANPAPTIELNARDPRPIEMDVSGVTIPVYGAAVGGEDGRFELNGQVIDRIAAPPGLRGTRNAYAVYVVGESMSPRYHEGETVYVHPGRPVRQGDYVVVQFNPQQDGEPYAGVVKRFVSRNLERVVVEQYNPPKRLEFDARTVGAIHRIVYSGE